MTPRFLITPEELVSLSTVALTKDAAHHALRVLRMTPGAPLIVFDGAGRHARAQVVEAARDHCTVQIDATITQSTTDSTVQITLLQGIAAAERMDWIIEKAVELGVSRVIPLVTQRSTVKLDAQRAERRWQHWRRIAIAACMQCGRNRLPIIDAPIRLHHALAEIAQTAPGPYPRLLLQPGAALSLRQALLATVAAGQGLGAHADAATPSGVPRAFEPSPLHLAVGPEAGFDADEVAAAMRAGFVKVTLGPRTLRTETAGVAALAASQTLIGDF